MSLLTSELVSNFPGLDYARRTSVKKCRGQGCFNSDSRQGLILAQMVDWSDHYVKVNAHPAMTRSKQTGSVEIWLNPGKSCRLFTASCGG
jgi:hypothetical protein